MRTNILDTINPSRRSALAAGLAAAGVAVLAFGAELLPPEAGGAALRGEYGVIELGSAVLLGTAALAGLAGAVRQSTWARWCGALLLVATLLRELDFQKRFTYRSIESLGFYTRPIAAVHEKLVAAMILAACAAAGGMLARAAWREWRSGVGCSRRWLVPTAMAVTFVGSGLLSEKVLRRTVAEEVFELAFAVCVVALTWRVRPVATGRGALDCGGAALQGTPWRPAEPGAWAERDERKAA